MQSSASTVNRGAPEPSWLKALRREVEAGAWEEGKRRISTMLEVEAYCDLTSLLMPKWQAWQLFVRPNRSGKALCLDHTLGTASIELARKFHAVYCLCPSVDALMCVQKRLSSLQQSRVIPLVGSPSGSFPFRAGLFDAVVLPPLGRLAPAECGPSDILFLISQWVEEARRVLNPTGQLFLLGINRFGYRRLKTILVSGRRSVDAGAVSVPGVERCLRSQGFQVLAAHPLLPEVSEYEEIIPASGEHSGGLKRSLWDRYIRKIKTSKSFMPAFLFVADREKPRETRKNLMELLLAECHARIGLGLGWESAPCIRRLLVANPNGAILLAGGKKKTESTVVIRIPFDQQSLDRCQNNKSALVETGKIGGHLSTQVPRFLLQGELYDQAYFVEEAFSGWVVDRWDGRLPDLTGKLLDPLLELHQRTARRRTITDEIYSRCFAAPLQLLRPYMDQDQLRLADQVDAFMKKSLLGQELPLVRTHGDYKIENVVFRGDKLESMGIIDWDLSRPEGPPFLDLIQLLTYNTILKTGASYERIILEKLLPQAWSTWELSLIQEYLEAMKIDKDLWFPLTLAYWLDHVAYRRIREMTMSYPDWAEQSFSRVAAKALEIAGGAA